jgi:hypothetical protein
MNNLTRYVVCKKCDKLIHCVFNENVRHCDYCNFKDTLDCRKNINTVEKIGVCQRCLHLELKQNN